MAFTDHGLQSAETTARDGQSSGRVFKKYTVGGQKYYHESWPLERKGSVVARSSLLHEKNNMVNNVFLSNLHTEAAAGERGRQADIHTAA